MNPELLTAMADGCFAFAKEMLEKAGEFYPFGEVADLDGKRSLQGAYNGDEHPNPREIYELLHAAFRNAADEGKIGAAALAANVDIPKEYEPVFPDGVRVLIEAPDYARFIYLPYRLGPRSLLRRILGRKREVEYAELIPVEISPQLFRSGA